MKFQIQRTNIKDEICFFLLAIWESRGRLPLRRRNEKGIALIMALIVMTMLFLLTLSNLEMLTMNIRIAGNHVSDLQALYVADAGIDNAIYELRSGTSTGDNSCGPSGQYDVTIENISTKRYRITSNGTIYNSTRSVVAEVRLFGTSSPYTVMITSWKEV